MVKLKGASMRRQATWSIVAVSVCLASLALGTRTWAQQTSTSTEVRKFEVVSVDGNKVVVRSVKGTQEITVPEDFRFDVDGRQVTVHELKPGMKGTATITTTTTVKPVTVTEIKNGVVMQASGSSIIVRGDNAIKMFTQGDIDKRNIKIMKEGKPVKISDLATGDHLTATIITEGPPQVLTQRQVSAMLSGAPASTVARAEPANRPEPTEAAGAPAAPAARLPKTASPLPAIGAIGVGSLLAAVVLAVVRRRRAL
jgi:hypothetical protein